MAKSPINNAGSRAGRGFRFQDAVGAFLAVETWAAASAYGAVVPEGHDDMDLVGQTGVAFAQIKSRRAEAGLFSTAEAAGFIAELWDRHDAAGTPPERLHLILERGVTGLSLPADQPIPLPPALLDTPRLRGDPRAKTLAARTDIQVLASPMERAVKMIADTLDCMPAEASIHYAEILRHIGRLSDENGLLGPGRFRSLTKTDVTALIDGLRALVSLGDMDAALQAGLCEAVDFLTPLEDEGFYLGVDVEPGHVAAGLVTERPCDRMEALDALAAQGTLLLSGPSGAGKSALMWEVAATGRHIVRWYRVRMASEAQVPALIRLARALRASPEAPVGFIFDDVGGDLRAAWDALARAAPVGSGLLLLGSIREEDLFLIETSARITVQRVEADEAVAERLWQALQARGQTAWPGWREPWEMAKGLMLEFAHILTQGERMSAVLAAQIDRRQREGRDLELAVLRIVGLAGACSAVVEADRLPALLAASTAEVSRALRRLVEEHLVRTDADGALAGLHQLRSAEILRLTHLHPPPGLGATAALAARVTSALSLEPLAAQAVLDETQEARFLDGLVARLSDEPDPVAAAAAFRGLGERHIRLTLQAWIPTALARGIVPTLITTAVQYGVARVDLPDLEPLRAINAAAIDLRAARARDPRAVLGAKLPATVLDEVLTAATPEQIEDLLAPLVHAEIPQVLDALDRQTLDLATLPLALVIRLLGTVRLHDPARALALAEQAGQDALLDRLTAETPWSSSFSITDEADGRVVNGEIRYVSPSIQMDAHGEVVSLVDKLHALVPDADIAAVSAMSPDGLPAGLLELPLATKRMARDAAPTEALPQWNRRWMAAALDLLGAPSHSDFLRRGHEGLVMAVSGLEALIEAGLRGKDAPKALDQLGRAFEIAQGLTSPKPGVAVPGSPSALSGAFISDLQGVLHDASTELPRKFINLPSAHGAFAVWTENLLERIDRAESEPWHLIGVDASSLFERLKLLVRSLQVLAGEAALKDRNPALLWRTLAKTARAGNALRLVTRQAAQGVARGLGQLESDVRAALAAAGLEGQVHVRPTSDVSVSWPLAAVDVVIPCEALADWPALAFLHWNEWRDAAGEGRRLTATPSFDGIAVGRLTFGGWDTPLPDPHRADAALAAAGHTLLEDVYSQDLSTLLDALYEQDAISLYGYGAADRPLLEQEALERAVSERSRAVEKLRGGAVVKESPDFPAALDAFIDEIDRGERSFARDLAAMTHGEITDTAEQIDRLQRVTIAVDLIERLERDAS